MVLETGKSPGDFLDGRLLLHIIESAPVGLGMRDAEGKVTYVNRRLVEMVGYPDASEIVGREVESFILKEELEAYRRLLEAARAAGVDQALFEELTAREREIFDRLIEGDSVREIAKTRFISEHTVRNHIKSIYRKLGLHSRLDLLRAALGR